MNELVSIIIPAYNAEKFISETIQSVLNQTYSDWELIIIDDGSKDNTAQIVKSFLNDSRIKYFFQKNSGVSSARNRGIDNASGKYIAFLDADDLWHPLNIEKKVEALSINENIDWVFGDMIYIDEQGNKIKDAEEGDKDNVIKRILLWEGKVIPSICSNVLIRRKCMNDELKFDANLSTAADLDFGLQVALKYKCKKISGVPVYYRVRNNSMSRIVSLLEKDYIMLYKKANGNKLFFSYWFKQKCFSNMYLILAGCWWKDANNKSRGLLFIFRALMLYPPNIVKLFRKIAAL